MNSIDFCFWLQGALEVGEFRVLDEERTTIIRNHLNLVFLHEIDPLRESQTDVDKTKLNITHNPLNDTLMRC